MDGWQLLLPFVYNVITHGDDLASTSVTKPEVHVENVAALVNPATNYSCKRRQLRNRRLITGRLLSDWSRVHASRFPASLSWNRDGYSFGVEALNKYRNRCLFSQSGG